MFNIINFFLILFAVYMIAINVITFMVYLKDKRNAIKHKWRVTELSMLCLAFAGGSLGAFLGMIIFRHKIRKKKFMILVPLFLAGHIILCLFMIRVNITGYTQYERPEDECELTLVKPVYVSSVDKDNDGIEDQADMLQSALDYAATEPIYMTKRYKNGYPTDNHGMAADVVAAAMKGAGYDLKELVNADIKAAPDEYNIKEPDENFDYRKIENLIIYFERNGVPASTNVSLYEEWQGGDIVIFKDHIGIVSDRRNIHGIPYIIHHQTRMQKYYEEDILVKHRDLVGHYRIS